jgi:integrase
LSIVIYDDVDDVKAKDFSELDRYLFRGIMAFICRKSSRTVFRITQEIWTPKRSTTVVKREAYQAIGLRFDMTFEEALERVKQINLQSQVESKKIAASAKRVSDQKLIDKAYLPKTYVQSFEEDMKDNYSDNPERLETLTQHWLTSKIIISELKLDPKDFYTERNKIFNHYRKKKWSADYIRKLTAMLNLWGYHYSRKTNGFFQAIPRLTPSQVERQVNAREDLSDRRTAADPLKWNDLKNVKSTFENEGLEMQWNWLFIGLFFGLRPKEIDSLHKETSWKIEKSAVNRVDVLMVYQTKLSSLSKDKRWKPIPLFFDEQKEAFEIIKSGYFKRPLNKTIQRLIEGQIETYSPRKGFVDLMLERGFGLEDISTFLGHSDINMTWKHYKDKFTFKLPKVS